MRRTDREVTDFSAIQSILQEAKVLHLALFDTAYPYLVPLNYGYEWHGTQMILYLHCAGEGHKLDLIRANGAACVEITGHATPISGGTCPCRYSTAYSSILARGRITELSDPAEKIHGLERLLLHQTGRHFALDAELADAVAVLRFTADSYTAKERKATPMAPLGRRDWDEAKTETQKK